MATATNELPPSGDDAPTEVTATLFAIIPEDLIYDAELEHIDVRVYGALRRHADNRTRKAWPSRKTLSREVGKPVSVDTVKRSLSRLESRGWISHKRRLRPGQKAATSNLYTVYNEPTFPDTAHDFEPRNPAGNPTPSDTPGTPAPTGRGTGAPRGRGTPAPTGRGTSAPGTRATQNESQLEPEHCGEAASANPPVDPPQQQQGYVPRERDDAAAADSMDHTPALAGRDAPRAANDPAAILDAAMLNPHEADQFRTWLRDRTGATNPDGLVVQLHRSGDLSARIIQWRSDSPTQAPTGVQTPPPARTAWCGLCDRSTRLTVTHDEHGHELVRRCPDCHPASGHTPPGAGASARLAQDAQLMAANNTGTGRAAYQEARAKLPTGARRRVTTHLDQEADPS